MKNLIISSVLLIIVGCNSQEGVSEQANIENARIENFHWTLIEFDGKPVPASVEGKVYIQLSKAENKLSGSNGCNRLMGSYAIANKLQISFSQIGSTRMACQNAGWDDMKFNQTLEAVNNFTTTGDRLMLHTGKRTPAAIFVKSTNEGIVNKYWKLKTLSGKEVIMAPTQEREHYLILRKDGSMTGFAGCNQFSGGYKLEEDKLRIRFENVLSTLRACPDLQIDEAEFLEVFELTDNYTMTDDLLMLNVGRRAPLATFEAVYF